LTAIWPVFAANTPTITPVPTLRPSTYSRKT
jgi:hypothetical protein